MDRKITVMNQVHTRMDTLFQGQEHEECVSIDEYLRKRMRVVIWKQWKNPSKRYWGLQKLGVLEWMAKQSASLGDH